MYTYEQYMSKECTYDEYYKQFVTPEIVGLVRNCIGKTQIKQSNDPYFNDIDLKKWDALDGFIRPIGAKINKQINGKSVWSLSNSVNVAKRAAKMINEKEEEGE